MTKKYPYYTPYQFAGNSPVSAKDIDGLEPVGYAYPSSTDPFTFTQKKEIKTGTYNVEGVRAVKGKLYDVVDSKNIEYWTLERSTLVFYNDPVTGQAKSNVKTESFYYTKPPVKGRNEGGKFLPYQTSKELDYKNNEQLYDAFGVGAPVFRLYFLIL